MFNVASSTNRRFCKYLTSNPGFCSLTEASVLHSNSRSQRPIFATFDRYKTTQDKILTHNEPTGFCSPKPDISLYEKYDFFIEKYRFSCSTFDSEQFHLEIIKKGLVNHLFLCNTLINVYVRNADLVSANKVFDEMPDKNLVTWACLISGYTQNEMPYDACATFGRMVSSGFIPNHYAIGSSLRACQSLGVDGLRHGMQIHGFISKTPHAFDVVVCNVLISMYGSCGGSDGTNYARQVFDRIDNKNSISWNSIISVYSQRGDAGSAFGLFSSMQKEGMRFSFKPTEYTFGSLIAAVSAAMSSCFDNGQLLLEQMLAKIEKSGFLEDLYVGSALVSGFAKFGLFDTANKIFQHMGARNAVSMNGLIVGLVKLKRGEEAVEVFMKMRNLVKINSDSFVALLSAFAEFSCLEDGKRRGKEVHGYLMRTSIIDSKITIGNSLINVYAKCGAIEDACSFFKLMSFKDSVSWSSMISGLDQNDRFEDALLSFCAMKRTGLMPSNFTLISALSSCGSLGWIWMGEQIHCEGIKLGLDLDVSVSNSLLAVYADTVCITECRKVFSLMPEHDQVSWNTIVGAFSDSESSIIEAVEYFKEMMQVGWILNSITFINILAAAASLSHFGLAHQVHALVLKYRLMDDSAIENALLSCYGKVGAMNDCENIFSRMWERRDDVSWNSMISGYIHNELLSKAMEIVWLMLHNGQRLDRFTFATVLSACASVATLERGMEVHACAIRACLEYDVVIGSALVDMYAKCGRIDYASRFFMLMPVRNVYSWNTMISGYARHGRGNKALELFSQMKLEGQAPDNVTFVGVLSACSHVGLVDQAFDHLESMTKMYGLTPRIEHFSCVVDLLGRAGEFGKMEDFVDRMPISPNVLIWRTVLGACGRANGRMADLGRRAAQMLLELEPQNAVNYVLLANMYASGEKWEDVAEARCAMKEAAAKKEAGCSWVTMKDGIHVFIAGDKSHPDTEAIYSKLEELHRKMKDAGYMPQIRYALYDLELENKEELLSYHSERLAVAFVLIRTTELPIRIMKNLRVCGDCHSAFKYISEIVVLTVQALLLRHHGISSVTEDMSPILWPFYWRLEQISSTSLFN
ncbi:putative Pentatricopeptide repeat-containing protein [Abeliophyllum distichum]|uniref:Pentatricopeptide repeat-containing protein n=1 Tax=Abeliophyllum distichum TaxID=126358 RepID=A0ABD1RA60_9LAMI